MIQHVMRSNPFTAAYLTVMLYLAFLVQIGELVTS